LCAKSGLAKVGVIAVDGTKVHANASRDENLDYGEGRRAWLREAKRRLEEQREREARPVPRDQAKRLREAKRRLDEELWTETRANVAYERYRATGRIRTGAGWARTRRPSPTRRRPHRRVASISAIPTHAS
jgi:hypothetical protein